MRSILLAAGLSLTLLITSVQSEDFRVESTVFENKNKQPISQTSTVFRAGVVYDYMDGAGVTAVLDRARGRFILLDATRGEKTEVKLEEISAAVTEMGQSAAKSGNTFLKFAANPKFDIQAKDDSLEFRAATLTYRAKCVDAPAAVVGQYREFADWTSRLNAFMNPAVPPPFPRLLVNAEFASRNLMPESVEMVIPKQLALGGRGLTLRSEHVLTRRLLEKDQDQVAKTANQIGAFKLVEFKLYRKNQLAAK